MTRARRGEKGLFVLCFQITAHHQRKSVQELRFDRNLEAGTDADAMEKCLLACSLCLEQPEFFTEPKMTSPEIIPHTRVCALLHQPLTQTVLYNWILLRHFLKLVFPLSEDSNLCQLDIKQARIIVPL